MVGLILPKEHGQKKKFKGTLCSPVKYYKYYFLLLEEFIGIKRVSSAADQMHLINRLSASVTNSMKVEVSSSLLVCSIRVHVNTLSQSSPEWTSLQIQAKIRL